MHTRSVLRTVLPLVDVGSGGIGGGRTFFDARGLGGVSHGNFGTGGFWFLNKLLGNSPAKIFNSFFTLFFSRSTARSPVFLTGRTLVRSLLFVSFVDACRQQ